MLPGPPAKKRTLKGATSLLPRLHEPDLDARGQRQAKRKGQVQAAFNGSFHEIESRQDAGCRVINAQQAPEAARGIDGGVARVPGKLAKLHEQEVVFGDLRAEFQDGVRVHIAEGVAAHLDPDRAVRYLGESMIHPGLPAVAQDVEGRLDVLDLEYRIGQAHGIGVDLTLTVGKDRLGESGSAGDEVRQVKTCFRRDAERRNLAGQRRLLGGGENIAERPLRLQAEALHGA